MTTTTLVPNDWTITCDSTAVGHGSEHRSLIEARECTWRSRPDAVTGPVDHIGLVAEKPTASNGWSWLIKCECAFGSHWLVGFDRPQYSTHEIGDKVVMRYHSTEAYGLWFVAGKA